MKLIDVLASGIVEEISTQMTMRRMSGDALPHALSDVLPVEKKRAIREVIEALYLAGYEIEVQF